MHPIQQRYRDARRAFLATRLHQDTLLQAHDFAWHVAQKSSGTTLMGLCEAAETVSGMTDAYHVWQEATAALLAWGKTEALQMSDAVPGGRDTLAHLFAHITPHSPEEAKLIGLIMAYGQEDSDAL